MLFNVMFGLRHSWYMNGNGPCFLALNLPSTMSSTFASFSSLCAASGGATKHPRM